MRLERFSGTYLSMGKQRGSACGELLQRSLKRLDESSPDCLRSLRRMISACEPKLERLAPELLEELQGVAEGAGLKYEDVFRLTFAEETEEAIGLPMVCSQIGVVDADGRALVGKSEDAGYERIYLITELRPERGHAQLHLGAANWVITSGGGMNDAGLCVGQSSVRVTDTAEGIPRLAMLRLVLNRCATVAEAVELFRGHETALQGINFLVADAAGDMAVIERSPTRSAVRRPQKGFICATNHYVDGQMRTVEDLCTGAEPDLPDLLAWEANTRQRYGRLCDYSVLHAGKPDVEESLRNLMRSHGPGGICQHNAFMSTTWAVIMKPAERQLWLADGYPCRSDFVCAGFEGIDD